MADSDNNNNSPVLNFRCPENIEKKIEAIGLEFYPKPIKTDKKGRLLNKRAYDVAQTILTIIEHGIDSINNDGIRTIDKTTQHTTEDITELRAAIASMDERLKRLESVASIEHETTEATTQPEPLPLLDAIDTATDTAIAVLPITSDNNLAITEIHPSQDAILEPLKQSKDDSQEMVELALNGLKRDELRSLVSHMNLGKKEMGKEVNDQIKKELKTSLLSNGITIEIFREWEQKNGK